MDSQKRKELKQAYQERTVVKGVLEMRCDATGEKFLIATNDPKATKNGLAARFNGGQHPNHHLQHLWNEHGEAGFSYKLVEELENDGTSENIEQDLKELLELCLERDPEAAKVWR